MAMKRFPVAKYASVELNQVAFQKTGMVISQLPISYEIDTMVENGMWVSADKSKNAIGFLDTATTTPVGIVYTSEKEYESSKYGLKNFAQEAGDYPRVGILGVGDTITSNCFCYDTSELADYNAVKAATTLYVKASTTGVPQLTKTAPNSGAYAKVLEQYTMPNGALGIKYQMLRV